MRASVLVNSSDRFPDRPTGGLHAKPSHERRGYGIASWQTNAQRQRGYNGCRSYTSGCGRGNTAGGRWNGERQAGMAGANREEAGEQATHSV